MNGDPVAPLFPRQVKGLVGYRDQSLRIRRDLARPLGDADAGRHVDCDAVPLNRCAAAGGDDVARQRGGRRVFRLTAGSYKLVASGACEQVSVAQQRFRWTRAKSRRHASPAP